jgi:hypothetical protein
MFPSPPPNCAHVGKYENIKGARPRSSLALALARLRMCGCCFGAKPTNPVSPPPLSNISQNSCTAIIHIPISFWLVENKARGWISKSNIFLFPPDRNPARSAIDEFHTNTFSRPWALVGGGGNSFLIICSTGREFCVSTTTPSLSSPHSRLLAHHHRYSFIIPYRGEKSLIAFYCWLSED